MEPVEGRHGFSLFRWHPGAARHRSSSAHRRRRAGSPAHPDVLRVLPNGLPCTHGLARLLCGERYRAYNRASQAMAEASNPHVVGWQTDNEINCGPHECICPSARSLPRG